MYIHKINFTDFSKYKMIPSAINACGGLFLMSHTEIPWTRVFFWTRGN